MAKNNVQINGNVYGGVHFHGKGTAIVQHQSAPVVARAAIVPNVVLGTYQVYRGAAWLVRGAIKVVTGTLTLAAWGTFSGIALGVWTLGRAGDVLRLLEHKAGGSHKRLIYVPSVLRNDEYAQLTEEQHKQLESDHVN